MFKFVVVALLIVASLLLPAHTATAAPAAQTCVLTTHTTTSVTMLAGGRRAQTVNEIARIHRTTARQIASLNPGIALSPLMVGQTLNVWHCDTVPQNPTPAPRTTPWSGFRCLLGVCSR